LRNAGLIQAGFPAMLSATLLVGCSLMALSDFSGGEQGAPDGSVSDAFSQSTDATDAAIDAPAVPDPTDGDATPAPFCASLSPQPSVCLDFDGDPAFGSWNIDNARGAKVEASSSAFVSAPQAAYFSRAAGAAPGGVMVLRYALVTANAPNELVLEADVRIEKTTPDDELDIMTVIFPFGADSVELQLSTLDGTYRLQQWSFLADGGNGGNETSFQRPIALGKWQHLRFTLKLGATRKALLEIDGAPAPEVSFTLPTGFGSPTLELGDGYMEGGASAFFMDNFTATVK